MYAHDQARAVYEMRWSPAPTPPRALHTSPVCKHSAALPFFELVRSTDTDRDMASARMYEVYRGEERLRHAERKSGERCGVDGVGTQVRDAGD